MTDATGNDDRVCTDKFDRGHKTNNFSTKTAALRYVSQTAPGLHQKERASSTARKFLSVNCATARPCGASFARSQARPWPCTACEPRL